MTATTVAGGLMLAIAAVLYLLIVWERFFRSGESRHGRAYFRLMKARRYMADFPDVLIALDWVAESGGKDAHPDIRALRSRIRKFRVEEEEQRIEFDRKRGFR